MTIDQLLKLLALQVADAAVAAATRTRHQATGDDEFRHEVVGAADRATNDWLRNQMLILAGSRGKARAWRNTKLD